MKNIRKIVGILVAILIMANSAVFALAAPITFLGEEQIDDSIINDNTNLDVDSISNSDLDLEDVIGIDETILNDDTSVLDNNDVDVVLKSISESPSSDELYTKISQIYAGSQNNGYKVFSEGKMIDFKNYDNVLPTIIAGRTMVPLRAMSESLGAKVDWNEAAKLITISLKDKIIKLTINNKTALVNGKSQELEAAATVIKGRTMVPLRFVGEAFGKKVGWYPNGDVKVISISNK